MFEWMDAMNLVAGKEKYTGATWVNFFFFFFAVYISFFFFALR
jgi:hypothetical protein